ncbi:hypothetical protein AJ80_03738 [Polytolypa hystricis UAMH7299]|uniref:Histone deacetylase complex subunit SAP30 Sin3 binding domain-containing protein n=1 Tax=Polytolypa hystricis (strain UAMH7299) TaxID=1447883 RepID=A0A2B7YGP3_POLH7|nr:hypothetical protein AJ80_03738 [Polytolypa hystricis UAMH7299]
MAPPRQRAANPDDSRSEASSSTKERQGTGSKGRKPANVSGAGGSTSTKDMKIAAAITAANQPLDADGDQQRNELSGISWSSMPLSILHDYRQTYNVSVPSAFSTEISSIVLSQGIGLRSPTAIAARRAQLAASRRKEDVSSSSQQRQSPNPDAASSDSKPPNSLAPSAADASLHRIATLPHGQGRVSKDHLAMSVRKHFNNVGLAEQDAIARFLYKVREEGKGREFRLRFQP